MRNSFDYDHLASDAELAGGAFSHLVDCDDDDYTLVQSLTNEADYIGRKLTTNKKVPGNIHKDHYREFWVNVLKPSDLVLKTISEGYSLPFKSFPPPSFERNNKSARDDMPFVRQEVKRLESLGCIRKVQHRPRCVLPLSSVFSKKKRLVVDGSRCLNPYLQHRRVRLQDHRDIPELVKEGFWFFTDDMDSGYWHIAVNPEHRKYLGIHIIEEDGSYSFYVWLVMFLGISDAVFIFSTLTKPIRSYLASHGIPNIIFIDDHLTGGATKKLAIQNNNFSNDIWAKAGWVMSPSKKQGPLKKILFLGLLICSDTMMFFIPEAKIVKLLAKADSLLSSKKVKLRVLASFIGLLQSCGRALGPIVRLMSRCMYGFLMSNVNSFSWNHHLPLDQNVISEIRFWQENIVELNGFKFRVDLSMIEIQHDIVTDASNIGIYGYRYFSNDFEIVLRRLLTAREVKRSSTHRELLAVYEIYGGNDAIKFKNSVVRHLVDNKGVVSILDHGSKVPELHEMAVKIFLNCRKFNISLFPEWKPRTDPLLVYADSGSRAFDQSSYSLDMPSFLAVIEFFGTPLDIDCMADQFNKKCTAYFSRFPDPFSLGANFFAQRLNDQSIYYCFPPPSLFTAAVLHLQKFGCYGLLLVPIWRSASFWTNVAPDGCHLPFWAKKFLIFKPSGFVVDPCVTSNTFKNKPVMFDMLVILFDFKDVDFKLIHSSLVSQSNCLKYGCHKCL